MSTSTALAPSVQAAFTALIDYAGLFPPAQLELPDALAEYAAARKGPHAWMLGRFIIPASRLLPPAPCHPEPVACHPEPVEGRTVEGRWSVILDAAPDPRAWFDSVRAIAETIAGLRGRGVRIEALEAPLPKLTAQRETYDAMIGQLGAILRQSGFADVPTYVELPRALRQAQDDNGRGAMDAARRAGLGVKIRCGGVTAEAFPTVDDVAGFIVDAVEIGVPFKATAGLHHPVRHVDTATGFPMHGFLNLLAAAALAPRADRETLRRIVGEEDPSAFAFGDTTFSWRGERVTTDELAVTRRRGFVAYGSCSFSEPVDDLTALGMLLPVR